jgi:hypothetical protein
MIKGLTDEVKAQFPNLGKLRKGSEKVGDKMGRELPYWRFTSERAEIVEAFTAAYGSQPTLINCYMAYSTPDEAFSTWCEIWGATGLVHRCDGETMSIWQEAGKYVRGSKPCAGGHDKNDPLNDAVGRLAIIIPELVYAGYVGLVTVETHGKHDILSISRALQAVYESRGGNGQGLHGIPFNLRRVPEQVSTPGFGNRTGQRSMVEKWNVKLEPAADWVRLQLDMAHATQMAGALPEAKPAPQLLEPKPENKPAAKAALPAQTASMEELNELGWMLWPGVWETVKETILKSKNIKGDIVKAVEFCEKRRDTLPEKWGDHVKSAYPDFAPLLPEIAKVMGGDGYDKLLALKGMAKAIEVRKVKNSTASDLVDVIISFLPIDMQEPVMEEGPYEPPNF